MRTLHVIWPRRTPSRRRFVKITPGPRPGGNAGRSETHPSPGARQELPRVAGHSAAPDRPRPPQRKCPRQDADHYRPRVGVSRRARAPPRAPTTANAGARARPQLALESSAATSGHATRRAASHQRRPAADTSPATPSKAPAVTPVSSQLGRVSIHAMRAPPARAKAPAIRRTRGSFMWSWPIARAPLEARSWAEVRS
jgi:hypothetical protein